MKKLLSVKNQDEKLSAQKWLNQHVLNVITTLERETGEKETGTQNLSAWRTFIENPPLNIEINHTRFPENQGGQSIIWEIPAPSGTLYLLKLTTSPTPEAVKPQGALSNIDNLARIIENGEVTYRDNTYHWAVMEKSEGEELFEFIATNKTLTYTERLSILKTLLKLVEDIDNKGFCHKDLKPENIIIYRDINDQIQITVIDLDPITEINNPKITFSWGSTSPATLSHIKNYGRVITDKTIPALFALGATATFMLFQAGIKGLDPSISTRCFLDPNKSDPLPICQESWETSRTSISNEIENTKNSLIIDPNNPELKAKLECLTLTLTLIAESREERMKAIETTHAESENVSPNPKKRSTDSPPNKSCKRRNLFPVQG